MSTAKEIIVKKLKEPYKSLALANMKNFPLYNKSATLTDAYGAICAAFSWGDTPEGSNFWSQVQDATRGYSKYPKVPTAKKVEAPKKKMAPKSTKPKMAHYKTVITKLMISPYKELALANIAKLKPFGKRYVKEDDLYGAIFNAFDWDVSDEGCAFWDTVANAIRYENKYPEAPVKVEVKPAVKLPDGLREALEGIIKLQKADIAHLESEAEILQRKMIALQCAIDCNNKRILASKTKLDSITALLE